VTLGQKAGRVGFSVSSFLLSFFLFHHSIVSFLHFFIIISFNFPSFLHFIPSVYLSYEIRGSHCGEDVIVGPTGCHVEAEDEGVMFLRNISVYLQFHMVLKPRRPNSISPYFLFFSHFTLPSFYIPFFNDAMSETQVK
jgi:hypothetical protein